VKAGERVDLIKAIAERITAGGDFKRAEADLIFEEFGFGYAEWRGTPYDYALAKAQSGTNEQVAELATDLNPAEDDSGSPSPARPEQEVIDSKNPWQTSDFKIFISHCTSHVETARKLKTHLTERGIEGFIAHESIQVSQEWEDILQVGLATCDAVLALLTPDFKKSDWTEQEIGIAVANRKLVVPLQHGGDGPHGFFGKYQGLTIHAGDKYVDIARKVFEALVRQDLTKKRMAEVLVHRFIESRSYEQVRERFVFLKLIPNSAWEEGLADQMRQACKSNSEIVDGEIDWRPAPDVVNDLLSNVGF